jgi:hypothetical protein
MSLYYPENVCVCVWGGLDPIWGFRMWWFQLDRKHILSFFMSDGCVMAENTGVSLSRDVTGWSFP